MNRIVFVTTAYDPSLDGIASAIGYAEYLVRSGEPAVAAFFGEPQLAAQYVRETFHFLPYKNAEEVFDEEMGVVLVAINETANLPRRIDRETVVAVLSNHADGANTKFPNAELITGASGACATLVAQRFFVEHAALTKQSALLLYSAIIAATVNTQATSTIPLDKTMAQWLKAQIDLPNAYEASFLTAITNLQRPLLQTVMAATQRQMVGHVAVGFGMLLLTNVPTFFLQHLPALEWIAASIKRELVVDIFIVAFVDWQAGTTTWLAVDEPSQNVVTAAFQCDFTNQSATIKAVILQNEAWQTLLPILKRHTW